MKTDMLSYYKEVLEKISKADAPTFRKELRKAFRRLVPAEREELKHWFRSTCVCRVEPNELQEVTIAARGDGSRKSRSTPLS